MSYNAITPHCIALPDDKDRAAGQMLLQQGQVGCLVVAGGHGSRLQHNGPKGTFPLSVVRHKTLFQLIAEKTLAASRQAGSELPLAIMTSSDNHTATLAHFSANDYFGLPASQLDFFCQDDLPYVDDQGSELDVRGPAGNGWCLKHFYEQGLWHKWHERGVKYVQFILVDNPLAYPFDPALVGYHAQQDSDVTVKSTWRRDPAEKVGVLVERQGKIAIVEYSEITSTDRQQHHYANLSLFCFSLEFIARCQRERIWEAMPVHKVYKPLPGNRDRQAWKCERYIFDVLPWAYETRILLYPRDECFAPLKEREGPDGIAAVQRALLANDRRVYRGLSGTEPPAGVVFELDQAFHYPSPALVAQWQGCPLPGGLAYISG